MKTNQTSTLHFIVILISLIFTACGSSSDDPTASLDPEELDYQVVINNLISEKVPGIILLVETPESRFLGSAGVSNLETRQAMLVSDTMITGSVGKKTIALLAAQLADEGLLNLDDTLDTWLDENILSHIPNSLQMTLRQLLNHTSGVFNFDEIDDGEAYENLFTAEPDVFKSDIDFLELMFDHSGYFLPGEGYTYSSAGYSLAALILNEVLGEHHSVAMRNRFFDPLGMTSTYYRGSESPLSDVVAGYYETDEGDMLDIRPFLMNSSEAGAPLVSSVEDMAIFLKALITDDSLANESVKNTLFGEDNLIATDAGFKMGLGISVDIRDGHTVYAHAGVHYGYMAESAYIEETETSIVLLFNCGGHDTCTNAFEGLRNTVLDNELM